MRSDRSAGRERSVVLFRVADGQFAVDARAVRHVERAASVPGRPPRFDGRPWPRVPLRALFGLPPAPPAHQVLVEDADGHRGALEVDAVLTLARLEATAIAPLPAVYTGPERRWVAGLGRWEGRVVIILHVGGVLVEGGNAGADIAG